MSFPEQELRKAYDELSNALQALQDQANKEYNENPGLIGKFEPSTLYPYFIFIHRARRSTFINHVLAYAESMGYQVIQAYEYEMPEQEYAKTQAIQFKVLSSEQRQETLEHIEYIRLQKDGARINIPLLKVAWKNNFFIAQLENWEYIKRGKRLMSGLSDL